MKKVFLFAALMAGLVLASCSSDDLAVQQPQPQNEVGDGAVGFDVYTQKATSRAGWTGSVTTTALKTITDGAMGKDGFGVFGYYTDNNEYEQRSVPNFMYNQQVTWNGTTAFTYEPVVYWPNEYGDKAISDDQDKLTFFAYAPYVKVIPSSGKVANTATAPDDNTKYLESYGITGMTKNTTQGDPILKYIGSFDNKKSVDLCWGVADNGDGSAWNITQTGNPQTNVIPDGMPWINMERPAGVDQKVRFTFKHATAQMRVSIDADIDVDGRGHTTDVTKKTRIWVRQITFKGFTMKGSLNLNNDDPSTPKWLDYNGQNELVAEDVVIYDGRKDGKEGVAGAVATNEKSLGLNPALIQDGVYDKGAGSGVYDAATDVVVYGVNANGAPQTGDDDYARPGVTKTAVNLFKYNNDDNKSQKDAMVATNEFFHVIPVNDNFEVEIVYDVETVDQNLAQSLSDGVTKGSCIENRISKTIKFGSEEKLYPGHSYTLALHLGMNSVKFDAAVTDWIDEAAQDVDLPLNAPQFGAENPVKPWSVTLPYSADVYTFAVTGLDGGESVAYAAGAPDLTWTGSGINANTSGVALQTITPTVNPNTTDRTHVGTWTGGQSGKGVEMTFTQKAHPLFMAIKSFANNGSGKGEITLMRRDNAEQALSATPSHWTATSGWKTAKTGGGDAVIKVWRNGAELSGFTFNDVGSNKYTNMITITDKLQPGDVIKVELTTGDAPTETVTATVTGISYGATTPTYTFIYSTNHKYDVAPTYVGNATPTYSFSPASATAYSIDDNGQLTTLEALSSPATITTTLGGDAGDLAISTTADFKLEITEQASVIAYDGETIATPFLKSALNPGSGTVDILDLSAKKAEGATYSDDEAGDLTFALTKVTKLSDGGDYTGRFQVAGDILQRYYGTATDVMTGDYEAELSVTGTAVTNKFTAPASKSVIIKFTVVNTMP